MPLLHPQQPLPAPEGLRRTRFQEVEVHYSFCITIMSLIWFLIFISINPHSCSAMISSWLGMTSCCIAFFFFCCGWAPGFALTLHITDVFSSNFSVLNIIWCMDWLLDWFPCFGPYVCGVLDPCGNGHRQARLKKEEKSSWWEGKPSWAFPSRALSVGGDLIVTAL